MPPHRRSAQNACENVNARPDNMSGEIPLPRSIVKHLTYARVATGHAFGEPHRGGAPSVEAIVNGMIATLPDHEWSVKFCYTNPGTPDDQAMIFTEQLVRNHSNNPASTEFRVDYGIGGLTYRFSDRETCGTPLCYTVVAEGPSMEYGAYDPSRTSAVVKIDLPNQFYGWPGQRVGPLRVSAKATPKRPPPVELSYLNGYRPGARDIPAHLRAMTLEAAWMRYGLADVRSNAQRRRRMNEIAQWLRTALAQWTNEPFEVNVYDEVKLGGYAMRHGCVARFDGDRVKPYQLGYFKVADTRTEEGIRMGVRNALRVPLACVSCGKRAKLFYGTGCKCSTRYMCNACVDAQCPFCMGRGRR